MTGQARTARSSCPLTRRGSSAEFVPSLMRRLMCDSARGGFRAARHDPAARGPDHAEGDLAADLGVQLRDVRRDGAKLNENSTGALHHDDAGLGEGSRRAVHQFGPEFASRRAIRFEMLDWTVPKRLPRRWRKCRAPQCRSGLLIGVFPRSNYTDGKYLMYSLERYEHGRHTY